MKKHIAILSIGSNMGDKLANCKQAIAALTADGSSRILARSAFYKTDPVDYTDQDWFINTAVKIETTLSPKTLLRNIQKIQRQAGREKDAVRFGPRIIDIDIIFFDDRISEDPELTIPHPRAHKRRFVLQPICDIDRQILHPVLKKSAQVLLDDLQDDTQGIERLE